MMIHIRCLPLKGLSRPLMKVPLLLLARYLFHDLPLKGAYMVLLRRFTTSASGHVREAVILDHLCNAVCARI
jgi:hypothetical protein